MSLERTLKLMDVEGKKEQQGKRAEIDLEYWKVDWQIRASVLKQEKEHAADIKAYEENAAIETGTGIDLPAYCSNCRLGDDLN